MPSNLPDHSIQSPHYDEFQRINHQTDYYVRSLLAQIEIYQSILVGDLLSNPHLRGPELAQRYGLDPGHATAIFDSVRYRSLKVRQFFDPTIE